MKGVKLILTFNWFSLQYIHTDAQSKLSSNSWGKVLLIFGQFVLYFETSYLRLHSDCERTLKVAFFNVELPLPHPVRMLKWLFLQNIFLIMYCCKIHILGIWCSHFEYKSMKLWFLCVTYLFFKSFDDTLGRQIGYWLREYSISALSSKRATS